MTIPLGADRGPKIWSRDEDDYLGAKEMINGFLAGFSGLEGIFSREDGPTGLLLFFSRANVTK
jgi:hypothetical protein